MVGTERYSFVVYRGLLILYMYNVHSCNVYGYMGIFDKRLRVIKNITKDNI